MYFYLEMYYTYNELKIVLFVRDQFHFLRRTLTTRVLGKRFLLTLKSCDSAPVAVCMPITNVCQVHESSERAIRKTICKCN